MLPESAWSFFYLKEYFEGTLVAYEMGEVVLTDNRTCR